MDTTNLKAWLPFDESATEDKLGNEWTTYGNPAIDETNAVSGKALQLDGASYLQNNSVATEIGDDIWTIHWRATASASGERFFFGTFNANYGTSGTGQNKWVAVKWNNGNPMITLYSNDTVAGVSLNQNQEYHYALSYDGTNLRLFIDGELKITKAANIKLGGNFRIGIDPSRNVSSAYFNGTIDEFIILKGKAWLNSTDVAMGLNGQSDFDFDADIERKLNNRVEFTADIERRVWKKWWYINPGDTDDLIVTSTILTNLPATQSKSGTAFWQNQNVKCFDIPVTDEIWIKFDVYFNGSQRWRAFNGGTNGTTGIAAQTSGALTFFANNRSVQQPTGICNKNALQTFLLHMVSGSTDGLVEAWADGTKLYAYTGDINHGEDFADIYLQSDGAGTFFSNVLISNIEPITTENDILFSSKADLERVLTQSSWSYIPGLRVWLPFNTSVTEDLCGNEWVSRDNPTIDDANAVNYKALQTGDWFSMDAAMLSMKGGFTLGGTDFTVCGWVNISSSHGDAHQVFALFDRDRTQNGSIYLQRDYYSANFSLHCLGESSSAIPFNLNENIYFEVDYSHSEGKVRLFLNGKLKAELDKEVPRTRFPEFVINNGFWSAAHIYGSMDEFQVFEGTELHTEEFTPPSANDYITLQPKPFQLYCRNRTQNYKQSQNCSQIYCLHRRNRLLRRNAARSFAGRDNFHNRSGIFYFRNQQLLWQFPMEDNNRTRNFGNVARRLWFLCQQRQVVFLGRT